MYIMCHALLLSLVLRTVGVALFEGASLRNLCFHQKGCQEICGDVVLSFLLIEDLVFGFDTHLILADFSSAIFLHVHELLLMVQLHFGLFLNLVTQPLEL